MNEEPREYTTEEIREQFIRHVWGIVEYWDKESREPTVRGKLEGVVHSIFAAIDGCALDVPAMIVAPLVSESDKDYFISEGENYYPINDQELVKGDIGGELRYLWFRMKPERLK